MSIKMISLKLADGSDRFICFKPNRVMAFHESHVKGSMPERCNLIFVGFHVVVEESFANIRMLFCGAGEKEDGMGCSNFLSGAAIINPDGTLFVHPDSPTVDGPGGGGGIVDQK